jgi:coenzyme F420-reducing hydrogenase alpha subunit
MVPLQTNSVKIKVGHITRVEGHGNIVVDVRSGEIRRCDLEIIEAPRYFESMLRGRPYHQAPHLASRICGICAVTHASASIRAVEKALGIVPSEQTNLLRRLNLNGEMLDSHILHVFMLVAPDFLNVGSVIALAKVDPSIVKMALRMKKIAGDICAAVCGRHTHPISMVEGGFTSYPSKTVLTNLRKRLEESRTDVDRMLELFSGLEMPDFARETEYISLTKDDEYCFLDGEIASTDSGRRPIEGYRGVTNEFQVFHSTAKHSQHQRQSYMVGALPRFKNNYQQLHPKARDAAASLNIDPVCTNPYMITIAQVVEIVHCVEDSIQVIQKLVSNGISREEPLGPARMSGEGVGACEAPRGTLYHNYLIHDGLIAEANCIIPTAQNLANIEADMRALVPKILDQPSDKIRMALEMLVRAYDPCISCSAHMLEVEFA